MQLCKIVMFECEIVPYLGHCLLFTLSSWLAPIYCLVSPHQKSGGKIITSKFHKIANNLRWISPTELIKYLSTTIKKKSLECSDPAKCKPWYNEGGVYIMCFTIFTCIHNLATKRSIRSLCLQNVPVEVSEGSKHPQKYPPSLLGSLCITVLQYNYSYQDKPLLMV